MTTPYPRFPIWLLPVTGNDSAVGAGSRYVIKLPRLGTEAITPLVRRESREKIVIVRTITLPLWVKTGSPACASECLLLGVKQKSILGDWMSACSQKRTLPPLKYELEGITHSYFARMAGTVHSIKGRP